MMSEAQEQCKLIKWADKCVQMKIHPELSMLYAVPNGGRRDKAEAAHLKRQGVRAGVPDLCLAGQKVNITAYILSLKSATIRLLNIRINGCRIFHGADTP